MSAHRFDHRLWASAQLPLVDGCPIRARSMRIVFFGSADFGLNTLESVIGAGHEVVGIVSTPERPQGRGRKMLPSPVVRHARSAGLEPVYTPDDLQDPQFVAALRDLSPDVFVVVAYRILPEAVFEIPQQGTINVHASLLPKYRGPAPIQRAIENGETETGVTIFRIDKGIDTGVVLLQRAVPIADDETTPQLYERLSALGGEAMVTVLEQLAQGTAEQRVQDSSAATRAPKLRKEEAQIDWRLPSRAIYNRIRAFKPFPGTWTLCDGKRLGVEWAEPVACDDDVPVGTVMAAGDAGIVVRCASGCLRITQVRPEGRNSMTAGDFLRGTAMLQGAKLG
ncbi:MAG: methionyl-tRNA formyltransferase [Chitinivibrionales bacterium]|nr:methionyl-tRNA formyltransferase [Chitinivibrionales bacterium]